MHGPRWRALDDWERLRDRAREFLEAARTSLAAERFNVAFDEARDAAELAAKALLCRRDGTYPAAHNVAGPLQTARLIPRGLSPKALSRLLSAASRGRYGISEPVTRVEAKDAVAAAEALCAAL